MRSPPDIEPVPGLPESLPAGEKILWQGSPDWRRLAVSAFHVRKVALYFGLFAVWRTASGIVGGEHASELGLDVAGLTVAALIAMAILSSLAWLSARATIYTITTRRIVMRFGVALPLTVNVPFRIVVSAGLRLDRDGIGDIPVALQAGNQLAYLALWPHARPWRTSRPEPMLRSVRDAKAVAEILSESLYAFVAAGSLTRGSNPESIMSDPQPLRAAVAG